LTEHLQDGTVTWEENSPNLEDRNSLSRVIRSATCQSGAAVQDLRTHRAAAFQGSDWQQGRNYATSVFSLALGGIEAALQATRDRHQELLVEEQRMERMVREDAMQVG